jgi:hypothetical protein
MTFAFVIPQKTTKTDKLGDKGRARAVLPYLKHDGRPLPNCAQRLLEVLVDSCGYDNGVCFKGERHLLHDCEFVARSSLLKARKVLKDAGLVRWTPLEEAPVCVRQNVWKTDARLNHYQVNWKKLNERYAERIAHRKAYKRDATEATKDATESVASSVASKTTTAIEVVSDEKRPRSRSYLDEEATAIEVTNLVINRTLKEREPCKGPPACAGAPVNRPASPSPGGEAVHSSGKAVPAAHPSDWSKEELEWIEQERLRARAESGG